MRSPNFVAAAWVIIWAVQPISFLSDPRQTENPFIRNAVLPWLAAVLWAALIFYLSARPSLKTNWGVWDFILRKAAHMAEFAALSLLLWNAIRRRGIAFSRALALAAAAAFLYACSDEFHQRYVPGRTGSFRDVAIDSAGIIVMGFIIFRLRPKKTAPAKVAVR